MVQLKLLMNIQRYLQLIQHFNSNMVQLKPINGKFTVVSETDFNSMMVQLKQSNRNRYHLPQPYFNSMMVQLKRNSQVIINRCIRFQFHDGTIKTHRHL